MIPNRYLIKKYLGRLLLGIVFTPVTVVLLFLVEMQSFYTDPFIQGLKPEYILWGGRIICMVLFFICFKNILSVIKIFMAGIPLTYKDIQRSIWINAWMFTVMFSGTIIAIMHILIHPEISIVLAIISAALLLALLVKRKRKRMESKAAKVSAQPHRTKDV